MIPSFYITIVLFYESVSIYIFFYGYILILTFFSISGPTIVSPLCNFHSIISLLFFRTVMLHLGLFDKLLRSLPVTSIFPPPQIQSPFDKTSLLKTLDIHNMLQSHVELVECGYKASLLTGNSPMCEYVAL